MLKRLFMLPLLALLISCKPVEVNKVEVSIDGGDFTLAKGEEKTLTYTVKNAGSDNPTPNVTWASDNPTVAKMEGDTVVALSAGTAKITIFYELFIHSSVVCTVTELYPTSIEIAPQHQYIAVNEEFELAWFILPSNAVDELAWESSKASHVSVDAYGKIKGHQLGEATITATTVNGLSASCAVSVIDRTPTAITIVEDDMTLEVGEKVTIHYAVTPTYYDRTKQVSVVSTAPEVATISAQIAFNDATGLFDVTAQAPGTTAIVVSLPNGVKSSIIVTVSDVMPVSLAFTKERIALSISGMHTVEYTLLPANATNQQLTWVSDHPEIATVTTSGIITGKKAGQTTIRAKTVNEITAVMKVTVYSPIYEEEIMEVEPNNSIAQAQVITHQGATLYGVLTGEYDQDYYSIPVLPGDTISLLLNGIHPSYREHFVVMLVDGNNENSTVVPMIGSGENAYYSLQFEVPSGPLYYIAVIPSLDVPKNTNVSYYMHVYVW